MKNSNRVRTIENKDTDPQDPFNTAINETRDINGGAHSKFSHEKSKTRIRDVTPLSNSTLDKLVNQYNPPEGSLE